MYILIVLRMYVHLKQAYYTHVHTYAADRASLDTGCADIK